VKNQFDVADVVDGDDGEFARGARGEDFTLAVFVDRRRALAVRLAGGMTMSCARECGGIRCRVHRRVTTVVAVVVVVAVAETETSTPSRSFVRALELARRDDAHGGVGAESVGAKP